jgi:hypothetical protein
VRRVTIRPAAVDDGYLAVEFLSRYGWQRSDASSGGNRALRSSLSSEDPEARETSRQNQHARGLRSRDRRGWWRWRWWRTRGRRTSRRRRRGGSPRRERPSGRRINWHDRRNEDRPRRTLRHHNPGRWRRNKWNFRWGNQHRKRSATGGKLHRFWRRFRH